MKPSLEQVIVAVASLFLWACQAPWQAGEPACADGASLDLPLSLADFAVNGSIRPFGVHGGNHPEGHPGIDFILDSADAREGIPILASLSAEIISITPESQFPGSSCILLDSACVEVNLCHVILDPTLKKGGRVKRGQRLGTLGLLPGGAGNALHFGVYSGPNADLVCPADFLNLDSVRCKLGMTTGSDAPENCGYAPGTVTLLGRSRYEEQFSRELSLRCEDGSTQVFALAEETALCNTRLSPTDRARMEKCLGPGCAGVW